MGEILAAIMGYLIGLEDSQPRVRCHRMAAIAASLFFLGTVIVDFYDGTQWDLSGIAFSLMLSLAIYVCVFLAMKCFARGKEHRN
ncbi:hypothetical protein [Achromobacter insolitus]|uniref:hypothetical protein n=1 Tax=Achromobacter insolitus TaxID=217204 RepID=UPI000F829666|nr:hypothetical protein [Achromobacter insolitus]